MNLNFSMIYSGGLSASAGVSLGVCSDVSLGLDLGMKVKELEWTDYMREETRTWRKGKYDMRA